MRIVSPRLDPAEFTVGVCSLRRFDPAPPAENASPIELHSAEMRGPLDLAGLSRLSGIIETFRPDVVHAWGESASTMASLALKKRTSIPLLSTLDDSRPASPRVRDRLREWLVRRPARLLVTSEAAAADYRHAGWTPDAIVVTPPAFDPDVIGEPLTGHDPLAFLPSDTKLMAAIGPLERPRHVDDLIWATDLLKSIRDDTHMIVIGSGQQRKKLVHRAAKIRVQDRVHFLEEAVDWGRLLQRMTLLWDADESLMAADAIVQALAQGLPVVLADTPRNRELVVSGTSGLLVPHGDRAAFASAAKRILDEPDFAQQIGDAARDAAKAGFAPTRIADQLAAVYKTFSPRWRRPTAERP